MFFFSFKLPKVLCSKLAIYMHVVNSCTDHLQPQGRDFLLQ